MRDVFSELRQSGITVQGKSNFERQLAACHALETEIESDLSQHLKKLSVLPRSIEVAQQRATLAKLQKDFDRIKLNIAQLSDEVGNFKLSNASNNLDSNKNEATNNKSHQLQQQQQQQFLTNMQGVDVDGALMEERHQDIVQLNKDLLLVKEMMR